LLAYQGEGQRAVKYFKRAIKIDKDSVAAHFGLGKTLQQYSEDKEAPIPYYLEVLNREPEHYKTLTQLGILYLERKEFVKSAFYLNKSISFNRRFPLTLVTKGNLLFERGYPDKAILKYSEAH